MNNIDKEVWLGMGYSAGGCKIGFKFTDLHTMRRRTLEDGYVNVKQYRDSYNRTLDGWCMVHIGDDGVVKQIVDFKEVKRLIKLSKL